MPGISKNSSMYGGKKNVDISELLNDNHNQTGGKKNNIVKKTTKKYNNNDDNDDNDNVSEYGNDNPDIDDESDDEKQDEDDQDNDEQNGEDQDGEDQDGDDEDDENYSEKSEKESNAGDDSCDEVGDDEKNYIDGEETLKKKCYSKYAKIDYDELDLDEIFGDDKILVEKNIRISKPVLTKYEFVRLLTDRTKQLAQGAKHMLKNTQELSSKEIAKLEIKEGVIPLIIERPIPNSKSERWKITELEVPEHFFSM